MLDFEGVKGREQRLGLSLALSDSRPATDVLVGRGLPPVLQFGHFGRWPRQGLRDLPAAQVCLAPKVAESFAERGPCLVDVSRAR